MAAVTLTNVVVRKKVSNLFGLITSIADRQELTTQYIYNWNLVITCRKIKSTVSPKVPLTML